jgi:hypothetical protein
VTPYAAVLTMYAGTLLAQVTPTDPSLPPSIVNMIGTGTSAGAVLVVVWWFLKQGERLELLRAEQQKAAFAAFTAELRDVARRNAEDAAVNRQQVKELFTQQLATNEKIAELKLVVASVQMELRALPVPATLPRAKGNPQ